MKNRLLFLARIGALIVINARCSKEDSQAAITIEFSRNALEYVQLAEGTRLVYRDSTTATLDTVLVTKSTLEKIYYPAWEGTFYQVPIKYPERWFENFSIILTKTSNSQQTSWFKADATSLNQFTDTSILNSYMLLNESYAVGPDNTESGTSCFYYSEDQIPDIFITLNVEGKTYNNVSVFVAESNVEDINSPYYRKATYYRAKGVGIIKKTIVLDGGEIRTSTLVSKD
ncbi:MAG: hypothetical protein MUO53_06050 [Maribacter sp.]|nr:hypothetical protein [Maribacter sp.]